MPDWHYGTSDLFEIINKENEVVGNIIFNHSYDDVTGNVEYNVFEEYRGNNYAAKALKLLAQNVFKISDMDYLFQYFQIIRHPLKLLLIVELFFIKWLKYPKNTYLVWMENISMLICT